MDQSSKIKELIKLYEGWAEEQHINITLLPMSGSYREYYRIQSKNMQALAVYNADIKENKAFLSFTHQFLEKELNVPKIFSVHPNELLYLIEDLGEMPLYKFLKENSKDGNFNEELKDIYKKVIKQLPDFQIKAGLNFDYTCAYPREAFDKQSMKWDLSYFKYYFLKLAKIPFDEQLLENDFDNLIKYLLSFDSNYFLYRDFQSMNIMIKDMEPYFIDYQGGRQGALQYDIASLLFDSKANIPFEIREELFEYYLKNLENYIAFDSKTFRLGFEAYTLIRLMQAMGAYGFRGFYERKGQFLLSIPYAVNNLEYILRKFKLPIEIPHLWETFTKLVQSEQLKSYTNSNISINFLDINIYSLSNDGFKKIQDNLNEGQVYVFDCNSIEFNTFNSYLKTNGLNAEIINYYRYDKKMESFLLKINHFLEFIIENIKTNTYQKLSIYFISKNGLIRSVYCAEQTKQYLLDRFSVQSKIKHFKLMET